MTDAKLSPMHCRVIDMVGEGKKYREIAKTLGCSISYVSKLTDEVRTEFGLTTMKVRDAVVFAYYWRHRS